MANWWIDEEYYPGPRTSLFVDLSPIWDKFKKRIKEIEKALQSIEEFSFNRELYENKFDPSWDEKKRREHALEFTKNRNIGPITNVKLVDRRRVLSRPAGTLAPRVPAKYYLGKRGF